MVETRAAVVTAIGGFNLVQNLLIPDRAYVPANLAATAGLVALARHQGCSWDDLGLDPSHVIPGLRLGAWGAALAGAATAAALAGPASRRYFLDDRAAAQRGGDVLYRSLVRFPLGTALFEEVAFRGVVAATWQRSGSSKLESAVAAAIAFGAWHIVPGKDALAGNPLGSRFNSGVSRSAAVAAGAVATGLASLGFSWMRERSGSLLAPWITHAAINSTMYLAGVAVWRRAARAR